MLIPQTSTRSISEASSLLITHSGRVILLPVQTDSGETGRPSFLPGLSLAAQGVHASPKVTALCHTDGCLSFLTEATSAGGVLGPMHRKQLDLPRTGSGQLCSAVKKEEPPSCKLQCSQYRLQYVHNPFLASYLSSLPSFLSPLPHGLCGITLGEFPLSLVQEELPAPAFFAIHTDDRTIQRGIFLCS